MMSKIRFSNLFVLLFLSSALSLNVAFAEEAPIKPAEAKLFDLPLQKITQKELNEHFAKIGGFKQSRSSYGQKHFDRYYSPSQLEESYYLDFRFNSEGQLTSATQLYRPFNHSPEISVDQNSQQLTPRRLAMRFVEQYGQPTAIERKGWGGFSQYNAYFWEDETLKITIDRQGSESLGTIFVRYEIKNIPLYLAQAVDK